MPTVAIRIFAKPMDHIPETAPEKEIGKSNHQTIDNSSDEERIIPVKKSIRFKFLASDRFLIVIAGIAIAVVIIVLIYLQ